MRSLKTIPLLLFSIFILSCSGPGKSVITATVTSIAEGDGGEGTLILIDKGSVAGIKLNQEGWVLEKGKTIATIRVDELKPDASRAVVLEHTPFKAVTEGLAVRFNKNGAILSAETSAPPKPCPDIPGPYVPTAGGNMARTGSYDEKGVPSPVGVLWKYRAFSGIITLLPSVADGLVFFGEAGFFTVDIEKGEKVRKYENSNSKSLTVYDSPTVLAGTIYIPDDTRFYAVDVGTGSEKWRFEVRANAPAVADGMVFLATYDDGAFFALDASTGKVKWQIEKGSGMVVATAVEDDTVYASSVIDNLWALDAKTGAVKWKSRFGDGSVAGYVVSRYVVVGDSLVYVCTHDYLIALDNKSGVETWRFDISPSEQTTPAVACDVVYVFSPGALNAVDAETGVLKWRTSLKDLGIKAEVQSYDPPDVVGGVVYFGGLDESVYAVDAETGKLLWSYKTEYKTSTPVVVDGVLYVTSGPYLYAIK